MSAFSTCEICENVPQSTSSLDMFERPHRLSEDAPAEIWLLIWFAAQFSQTEQSCRRELRHQRLWHYSWTTVTTAKSENKRSVEVSSWLVLISRGTSFHAGLIAADSLHMLAWFQKDRRCAFVICVVAQVTYQDTRWHKRNCGKTGILCFSHGDQQQEAPENHDWIGWTMDSEVLMIC